MTIYAQQKVAPKEESEATAQKPVATSGAKLTSLKTEKPVNVASYKGEPETNKSMEDLLYKVDTQLKLLKDICEMERRKYPNWINTYTLDSTSNKRLNFGIDTNNTPIVKIVVLAIGSGLSISLNGSDYFSATIGDIYEGEFKTFDYVVNVADGQAFITAYARIDK